MRAYDFPVDAVYLWCDGDDPKFIASRIKRENELISGCSSIQSEQSEMATYLDQRLRYANHDELKYSLRSLEKHAPWINHIYIVTNKQRPIWLNNNKKVSIVDHSEIIPTDLLPTFNSCTIEQYIVNINGLSEHFILMNDDMFFNKDTPKKVFFKDKKPIVRMQKPWNKYIKSYDDARELQEKSASPYLKTVINGYLMMLRHGRHFIEFRCPTHCIDAYSKSILLSIFKEYPEIYKLNVQPFRNTDEVTRPFWLLEMTHFYGCPLKINKLPKTLLDRALFRLGLKEVFGYEFQAAYKRTRFKDLVHNLKKYSPYTFCCNNLTGVIAERTMRYLDERFPDKSSFEL